MGKRNVKKRREEERQQSISGHNKKVRTGGLNRKERQNLMDFGNADGDPLSLMDGEDQGFEGKTWTFDANNEVISKGNENEIQRPAANEEAITLLGSTTSLSSVQLGKKRVVEAPKLKKQANTFSKLLSNLKRNKKVLPEVIEEVKVIAPSAKSDDPSESEAEIADEDELQSEVASDEEAVEVEEDSSDEEATVQVEGSVYRNHFGNDSYGEKELEEMVAKATEKKWKTQQIFPTDQTTTSDVHIFLSTLEGQETKIDALVKHSSATPPPLVLDQLAIKPRLHQPWRRLRKNGEKGKQDFGLEEGKFFFHLSHYRDIFFPLLTPQNNDAYKEAYVLHALNHVFKTRDTILKSNFKMAKAKANGIEASEVKDSSFTRPKVLILLPFRSAALKVVKLIYELSGCEQQENRKRFLSEFSLPEGEEDPISRSRAPDDHKITFAGNTDDCFKIGIKVTRKSLKLYSPFYGSDIIVASPLGLRLIVGDPEGSSKKKKDHDFLSSVEMLVLDQADHLLMQNWDHTTHILRHTNLVPKDAHGCDFSRLKSWYLNSHAPHLRQTILLSQMATPDLNHLFHGSLTNVAGQVRFRAPNPLGSIADTSLPTRHFFFRVTCRSHAEADDARFNFFKDSVLPAIRRKTASGGSVLLFIPSYFDFTRVRNYLTEHEYQFGQASEYTDVPTQTRDRMAFSRGKTKLLLYTGRCHFYRRFRSKGAHQIVFYGLPEYAAHYPEIINSANAPDPQGLEPEIPITVLFTVYDILKLERILGDARAQKACHGAQATLVFS